MGSKPPLEALVAAYLLGGADALHRHGIYIPSKDALDRCIMEAMGAASMCWANVERAGTFDSARAMKAGVELRTRLVTEMISVQLDALVPSE